MFSCGTRFWQRNGWRSERGRSLESRAEGKWAWYGKLTKRHDWPELSSYCRLEDVDGNTVYFRHCVGRGSSSRAQTDCAAGAYRKN